MILLCLKQAATIRITSSTVNKTANSRRSDLSFHRYVRQTLVCSWVKTEWSYHLYNWSYSTFPHDTAVSEAVWRPYRAHLQSSIKRSILKVVLCSLENMFGKLLCICEWNPNGVIICTTGVIPLFPMILLCLKQGGAYNLSTSSTVDKTVNSERSDLSFRRYVGQTLVCQWVKTKWSYHLYNRSYSTYLPSTAKNEKTPFAGPGMESVRTRNSRLRPEKS